MINPVIQAISSIDGLIKTKEHTIQLYQEKIEQEINPHQQKLYIEELNILLKERDNLEKRKINMITLIAKPPSEEIH